jgi:hypothetical protein
MAVLSVVGWNIGRANLWGANLDPKSRAPQVGCLTALDPKLIRLRCGWSPKTWRHLAEI